MKTKTLVSALALSGSLAAEPPRRAPSLLDKMDSERPVLSVDFEKTREGEIPRDFTKEGDVAVTEETAHTGKKSLRIGPAESGPRRIVKQGDEVTKLGGRHWGRLYLKVKLPHPVPALAAGQNFAVIHSTIVEGRAKSPLHNDAISVRLFDTCTGPKGTVQYLFNVQPASRPEFGKGSAYDYQFSDEWTLVEWFVDHETQTYQLYIKGREIPDAGIKMGKGKFAGAEIPAVFESLAFGWNNYQSAGAGFTAWIDDIALGKERLRDKFLGK